MALKVTKRNKTIKVNVLHGEVKESEFISVYRVIGYKPNGEKALIFTYADRKVAEKNREHFREDFANLYDSIIVLEEQVWFD